MAAFLTQHLPHGDLVRQDPGTLTLMAELPHQTGIGNDTVVAIPTLPRLHLVALR